MDWKEISATLEAKLSAIDFDSLPVSEYNKRYIRRIKPALKYYISIYASCLQRGMKALRAESPGELSLVDFGGGSGFLSFLASQAGFGEVIYVDLNPKSVETVRILKEMLGFGPSGILQGSSGELLAWCKRNGKKPHLLVATDLIEHVYDLPLLFKDLAEINNRLVMLFTTASTPYNPFVKKRLYRWMDACEDGTMEQPNYRTLRYDFIRNKFPNASEEEAWYWADLTRGLVFGDIMRALDSGEFPALPGKHNTCDPRSGNWMERVLPISAYSILADSIGFSLRVEKGFYNDSRDSRAAAMVCRCLNYFIRFGGKAGLFVSPFIFLTFMNKRM